MASLPTRAQGVQLPSLGTFFVSKALDTMLRPSGNTRPFFTLLDGRFSSVPQHRGTQFPAHRGPAGLPSFIQVGCPLFLSGAVDACFWMQTAARLETCRVSRVKMPGAVLPRSPSSAAWTA